MQTPRRNLKIGGDFDLHPVRVNHGGGAGLHNFLDGFHARPHTRKTAHGKGMHPQIQNLLHIGRKEYRRTAGLENMVALVRCGGALGNVVITGYGDHTTPGRGARHVGVFEHIRAAVHTRPLAVPDAEHTVVFVGAGRCKTQLLRTPQRGGGQLLVHTGLEHHMVGFEVFFGLGQRLVIGAQG
ncbi:MAG: hypothetical protein RIR45_344 [Pseudomonadota bacterium]